MRCIRKAAMCDLPIVERLIEIGRCKMRADGNIHQWSNNHPRREVHISDIECGACHLIEEDGQPVATFTFLPGPDSTYSYIEDGAWINEAAPYYVIHRIASAHTVSNVMQSVLEWCNRYTDNIRIDTHRDNLRMRHLLEKHGFKYCGKIYLEDGNERLAFQKSL